MVPGSAAREPELTRHLIRADDGYFLVRKPAGGSSSGAVLLVHGLGENRSGNNYLLSQLASRLAVSGLATVTFDLAGCGEDRRPADAGVWRRQVHVASALALDVSPGRPVHCVSHGTGAAVLPAAGNGRRVAISPPHETALLQIAEGARNGTVEVDLPLSGAAVELWRRAGTHPGLLGGLALPADLFTEIARGLAARHWDVELIGQGQQARAASSICLPASDPAVAMDVTRLGVAELMANLFEDVAA
jgi:predicted alpha/beta hydrolase